MHRGPFSPAVAQINAYRMHYSFSWLRVVLRLCGGGFLSIFSDVSEFLNLIHFYKIKGLKIDLRMDNYVITIFSCFNNSSV